MAGIRSGEPGPRRSHPWVREAGRGLAIAFHRGMHVLMDAVVRVYFRRVGVIGLDRLPARGAVLVVANHPAAWTDALVLDVALRRELNFVAHDELFHPWVRGVFLRMFASLPVRPRHEGPQAVAVNRRTFEHCHARLRRGAAIAVFPEGVSAGDRGLRPLKTGAARLVLEHVAAGYAAPALLPVAIHYEDRTGFRTLVEVAVGTPVGIGIGGAGDPGAARHALTAEIGRALAAALADAAGQARIASDASRAVVPRPVLARALDGLVAGLAAAGAALHAPPAWAIEGVASRFAGLPQQISFGRMLSALVILPLWYGGLLALAGVMGGGAWFALPGTAPFLGLLACREVDRRHDRSAARRGAAREESA